MKKKSKMQVKCRCVVIRIHHTSKYDPSENYRYYYKHYQYNTGAAKLEEFRKPHFSGNLCKDEAIIH